MTAKASPASDGTISAASALPFAKTASNLAIALERRGMAVYARIDHAANAAAAGLGLRPTQVFVFGFPEVETPILARCPGMGLDLPRKILVWQDESGKTWLSYDDPLRLGWRYGVGADVQTLLQAMATAFKGIVLEAGGMASKTAP